MITPTLILPHQGGGEFFRELDAPQLCCGVLHPGHSFAGEINTLMEQEVGKMLDFHPERSVNEFIPM